MDIRKIMIANAACMVLFSAGCAETARHTTGRPKAGYSLPSIKKDCTICHLPANAPTTGQLKKKLSDLCLDCHRDRVPPTDHKVDIVPRREVKGLPLFDGKITCTTCHDPHANTHGSMLRMNATDLCQACHPV